MTDLEKIIDMYPQLRFWLIEVDSSHYNGHIIGNDVYINRLQPDIVKLKAAIHEATHFKYDTGDCSDRRSIKVLKAEGWAIYESESQYRKLFG